MKMLFTKRTTITEIELEMNNLAKRREDIERRIADTRSNLVSAKFDRRESLSEDGDLVAITAKIRELSIELADLETLLVDIDAQEEDAAGRLLAARDTDERAKAAASLEKVALAAELRIAEIEKAVVALTKAISGLKADLDDSAAFWSTHNAARPAGSIGEGNAYASSREAAAAILAEAIAKSLPWAFDTAPSRDGYRSGLFRVMDSKLTQPNWTAHYPTAPLSVPEIVDALITRPLRDRAAEITTCVTELEKPQTQAADDYVAVERPGNVIVFVKEAFSFIGSERGDPEIVASGWTKSVPEPVADKAEEMGLCVRADSHEGLQMLDAERARKGHTTNNPTRPSDCIALGDVMGLRRLSRDEQAEVKRAVG